MGEIEVESSGAKRVDEVWLTKRESPLLPKLTKSCLALITVRYRFYRLYLKCSNTWCSTSSSFTSTRRRFSSYSIGIPKGSLKIYCFTGIRDVLIRASGRREVTPMVWADCSKAFDIVQFRSVDGLSDSQLGVLKLLLTMDD